MHGREEIQGCRDILAVLPSEWQEFCFFSPASSLTLCVEPPFITVHHQSEQTSSSRQNMVKDRLVKEGWLAKPARLTLEMKFWNLVWQAQSPLPPRSFQGSCAAIPQLWAGWGCPIWNVWLCELSLKRAAGSYRRRWVFNIMIKYEEETPCSSWLQLALGSSSLVWNAALM